MYFLSAPVRLVFALLSLVLMILSVVLIYLFVAPIEKRKAVIARTKGLVAKALLKTFNIQVEYFGQYNDHAAIAVANHVSWLDVVLMVHEPKLHFVAKSEVKDWPVIGFMTQILGTLFIRRDNKFQVYRSLPKAQRLIQQGDTIMVFPEGTTTTGHSLLPFYPMMFDLAVRERGLVQPIAIRYWNQKGEISQQAAFIDEDGILTSIFRLLTAKVTYAQVHYLPVMDGSTMSRKDLAKFSKQAIQASLDLSSPPETQFIPEGKRLISSRLR